MRKRVTLFLKAVLWGMLAVPVCAGVDVSAADSKSFSGTRAEKYSLEEISRLVLRNSLDVQIALYEYAAGRTELPKERSLFDTYFALHAGYTDDQTKPASIILGTRKLTNLYSASLEKTLPTGTTLSVEGQHARDWTDSAFSTTNPAHEGQVAVSLVQPIGKNFFGILDRYGVRRAALAVEGARWLSLDEIEQVLAEAQEAYWTLALQEEELKVREELLADARALQRTYEQKQALGTAIPSEVFAHQANVKARETEAIIARLERETAKNQLLFLLNEDDFQRRVSAQDELRVGPETVSLEEELREAVSRRRDYQRARTALDSQNIYLAMKKNSLWPQIDLEATYAKNGLSDRFGEAWEGVRDEHNSSVFFGVTIRFPLENTKAEAEYAEAEALKQKHILFVKRVEREIFRELHTLAAQVNAHAERVKLARRLVELQTEKLKAEQKRFRDGLSSSDRIIRYQEDVLNARLEQVRAWYAYRLSRIDLGRAKNALLSRYWDARTQRELYEDF
ncbi:MAG: hypothetical protein GF333_04920 [Candidatus Omnitrophica bacterium]|nr:hypothetical protein [Candidatus Omnitrophota bacterium]